MHTPRQHTIAERLFEDWMETFTSRIGREQSPHATFAYYEALCKIVASDDEFHRAAQRVFEKHAWNTWPAPVEFESAVAYLRRIPDAEIKQTYAQYIAPARQIAAPTSGALEAFAADWRAALRRVQADPDSIAAERRAARFRANDGAEWASDERPPARAAQDAA